MGSMLRRTGAAVALATFALAAQALYEAKKAGRDRVSARPNLRIA